MRRRFARLVTQFNELVYRINTLGTNALNHPVAPLNEQEELTRFLRSRAKAS